MVMSSEVAGRVPLVDLSGAFEPGRRRDHAVEAIRRACEDVGFLVITGHGVSSETVQRIEEVSRQFFALRVVPRR